LASQGVVRLYKLLPDGRRQILAFALPGERDELTRFIQSSPNIMRLLIEFATRELDMAQDQLLLLGNGSAEEKGLST